MLNSVNALEYSNFKNVKYSSSECNGKVTNFACDYVVNS